MGTMFTDNMQTARSPFVETAFHNNGLYNIGGTGAYPPHAQGLAEFTGRDEDMAASRTPSLRNVSVTAPYIMMVRSRRCARCLTTTLSAGHDYGRALRRCRRGSPNKSGLLIGFEATEEEINDLIAFLESLTDESFLTNPAYADPWPEGHPARATRVMPGGIN